ncbi:hypothetical protein JCM8547_003342 [Rhodosporidiobolus lusitaniae]
MPPPFVQSTVVEDPALSGARAARRRGPLGWHLRRPTKGPKSLAIKNHFIAMVGEFVGTSLFMIFALGGTNVANIPTTSVTGAITEGQGNSQAAVANTSNLLYIALSFGFSLAVNAWIFFRVSGGLFNPAVSLGMWLVGALTWTRAALLTISQLLGGIVGAAIIQALLPGTLNVRTSLSAGTSVVRGLFIEMFLTSLLMITILLLAAEKHKATFLAPIGIGLALFVAELLGVFYTGGSLNPARSFGPAVVLTTFSSYHWIYWLGPALGATIAAGFYKFIKFLEYENVLGPEDPVPAANAPTQLQAPGATLLGGPSPASSARPQPTTSMGEKPVPPAEQSGNVDVQGPGLADLLTAGPTEQVFSLPQPPTEYGERLERIEALLAELVMQRQPGAAVGGEKIVGGKERVSVEGTLYEEPTESRHVWKRDSPV